MVVVEVVGLPDGDFEGSQVEGEDIISPMVGMKLGSLDGAALIEGAAVGSTIV